MSLSKRSKCLTWSIVVALIGLAAGCNVNDSIIDALAPTVVATSPSGFDVGAATNGQITATFSEAMNATTLTQSTFTLTADADAPVPVAGSVEYDASSKTATFTPVGSLAVGTLYTATVSSAVENLAGNQMAASHTWTFTTDPTKSHVSPVALNEAADFVILAQTKVSTTGATAITGDLGLSPAATSYFTGFGTLLHTSEFETSDAVTGKLYAADMAVPTPTKMTTAISAMQAAYTDAAGRTSPGFTELGAGDISGLTLYPGLYKWGTGVLVATDVVLSGDASDVWILQIAGDLTIANSGTVTLIGGALPENIFWQVAGQVTLGTTSDFAGIVLSQTQIVLETGATMRGRALAQTAVTLDANVVTAPLD